MHFVMLVPRSLDPSARGRKMPVPDPRPSEKIAKLFPQLDPSKGEPKDAATGAKPAQPAATVAQAAAAPAVAAKPVPLPEARPDIRPVVEPRRHRRYRHYRSGR